MTPERQFDATPTPLPSTGVAPQRSPVEGSGSSSRETLAHSAGSRTQLAPPSVCGTIEGVCF